MKEEDKKKIDEPQDEKPETPENEAASTDNEETASEAEASEETLDNYETLVSSAEKAAKNQVTLLAKSASNDYDQIIITFAN